MPYAGTFGSCDLICHTLLLSSIKTQKGGPCDMQHVINEYIGGLKLGRKQTYKT